MYYILYILYYIQIHKCIHNANRKQIVNTWWNFSNKTEDEINSDSTCALNDILSFLQRFVFAIKPNQAQYCER